MTDPCLNCQDLKGFKEGKIPIVDCLECSYRVEFFFGKTGQLSERQKAERAFMVYGALVLALVFMFVLFATLYSFMNPRAGGFIMGCVIFLIILLLYWGFNSG